LGLAQSPILTMKMKGQTVWWQQKQSKKMFVGLTKEKNGDYRFSETKKESSSIEATLVLDRGHGDHDPSPGKHHKRDPHSRANRLELFVCYLTATMSQFVICMLESK
jgi:hypothetical protein